ncbi:MAG: tail fiber domain-containing protein [Bacteroidota bacterium]
MKKVFYSSISALSLLLFNFTANAQNVGIGTVTPDASARLEISATNKGLLVPRISLTSLTDNSTISAPATSLLIYNINNGVGAGYYFNSGTPASPVWTKLLTSAGSSSSGWSLTGNAGTDTAVNFLGTTDNQPIIFRTNNIKSGQLTSQNIYLGDSAGINTKETVSPFSVRNVAIGRKAFLYNDSGSYNVAIGAFALGSSTSEIDNVAVGDFALASSDDYYGGGSINTAVGSTSMANVVDGQFNTALGGYTMLSNFSGFANTAVGTFADCLDTLAQLDVNNATAIGFAALADIDDMVRIGNEDVQQIGGQVEWSTLSDGRFKKDIRTENTGLDFIMQLRPVSYHYDFQQMRNSRIKQLTKASKGLINGHPDKKASKLLEFYNSPAYKTKVVKNESKIYNGFIAQEVEAAAKKIGYDFSGVVAPTKPNGKYALRYATFVVPLIEAVQQQQQTIEEQNKKIDDLIKRLEKLEKK